jgi:hypothetical protein
MGLFRRQARSSGWDDEVPDLAALAAARGWTSTADPPFGRRLADLVHRSTWILYDRPFTRLTQNSSGGDATVFNNAYDAPTDGRRLFVANAWTNIGPQELVRTHEMKGVALCAVELTSLSPIFLVQPRPRPPVDHYPTVSTGDADFDRRFMVALVPGLDPSALPEGVRERIGAHDDWVFVGHDSWLACISQGGFESADEVSRRFDEMLGIIGAFPETVLPKTVDHSVDDFAYRIRQLHSPEDAITFIEQLTPDDRERLAQSNTPLAAFSDVGSRDEVIARFGTLDTAQRMALLSMFKRDDDGGAAG